VADIFNEVDEEVRREQLKKLWDKYQNYIIAVVIVTVVAVGGWRAYQWRQAKEAARAGAAFDQAMTLSAAGKHAEAEAAFAKIAQEGSRGYRELARMQAAGEIAQRDAKAGVQAYDAIASDQRLSQSLRDLAAVKAATLLVDTEPYDNMRQRLEAAAAPDRTYRHTARELLAVSAWRANDAAVARKWAEMINGDPAAPPDMQRRMQMLLALLVENAKS